jgi:hypothetical protein
MVVKAKVDILSQYEDTFSFGGDVLHVPAVARLTREVPRVRRSIRFGRMSVYLRDGFRCCYCGKRFSPEELTYDHVIPRDQWKGDKAQLTDWENIVTCCWDDNQRKRNRTPAQAGMKLLRKPFRPTNLPPLPFFAPKDAPEQWRFWLAGFDELSAVA